MVRIQTLALGLAFCAGAATAAAAQATTPEPPETAAPSAQARPARPRAQPRRGMFRGIRMTDDQRARLQEIRAKYREQERPLVEAMRPALREARTARQRGDTTAARAALERVAGERTKLRALREQQLGEVRAMLTPEQRQQFDQNLKQRPPRGHGRRGERPARSGTN